MAVSSRKCFPLAVLHIFFYSAVSCLVPFLNLHARELGLNTWESSLTNLVAAVLSALGALGAFALSRSCGRPKLLSIPSLFVSALAYTSLIFIPRAVRIPRHPLMEFDCSAGVRLEKCANWPGCTPCPLAAANITSFTLSDCQYVCRNPPANTDNVTDDSTPHICFKSAGGNFCEVYDETAKLQNTTINFRSRFQEWHADHLVQVPVSHFLNHDPVISTEAVDVCMYKPTAPLAINRRNYDDIFCWSAPDGCDVKCSLTIDVEPDPSNCLQIFGDPVLTFWAYLGVRSVADTFLLSSVVLLDSFFVAAINDFKGFYGRSRLWPALGLALFPPLAGYLVDYYSSSSGLPDYSPAFFVYDGLILITCVVVVAIKLESGWKGQYVVNSPSKRRTFWSLELGVLFTLVLTLGTLWGVLDSFLPALFLEVGCSRLMVGASAGLPFLCSLPFLAVTKNLVRNIGQANLLVFAFLFYAIRFAGLSFVAHPLWTLPFQAMQTFSLVVAWIAAVAYAHSLVSQNHRSSVHFALYFLHFGAGRAFGTVLGAALEEVAGLAWTFRGLACFCLVQGLLYLLLYHTCIKRRARTRAVSSSRGAPNGGALFPMEERRQNGDAVHEKEDPDSQLQAAGSPMMTPDPEDK